MVKSIILAVGTATSIISLSFNMQPWGKIIAIVAGILCLAYLVYIDVIKSQENTIICHNEGEIRVQMQRLIKMQGKICIMSRDLSWITPEIEASIIHKGDSMLIFAQRSTELTKRMADQGVSIYLYGDSGFEPKTRFTIIRFNQIQPQVAIAKPLNKLKGKYTYDHKIYEAESENGDTDAWLVSLALDLMELCKKVGIKEVKSHE